jgi:uncharacterized protein
MVGILFFGTYQDLFSENRSPESIPNPKSVGSEWHSIFDETSFISNEEKTQLQTILDEIEKEKGVQIAIVILDSIGENEPKTFAHDLFQHWGIGRKGIDDGLLFLLVQDQRKWIFETGYGLEGTLPDVILKRIGENILVPKLKEGNQGVGLIESFQTIATIIQEDGSLDNTNIAQYNDWGDSTVNQIEEDQFWENEDILMILIIVGFAYGFVSLFFISDAMETFAKISKKEMKIDKRLAEMQKFWKKPWVKYGFIFFLPMMIAIGFIYLSHRRKLVDSKKDCPACGKHTYEILPNQQSHQFMDKLEAIEHKVGSTTTLVWRCSTCKHSEKITTRSSTAEKHLCPACNHYTVKSKFGHTIISPTYTSGGSDQYIDECLYCGNSTKRVVSTPKLVREVEKSSFSSRSDGISYSGSSSRSSGSSWGGGRSGGGGASGSW